MSSPVTAYPTTIADDPSVGTSTWTSTANASADDGSTARNATSASSESHYLLCTGFGFAIPSGATIDGIVVEIDRVKSGSANMRDRKVRLVKAGVIQATGDKADTATNWPTSSAVKTYGVSNDLWSQTLTATDVNDSGFGVAITVARAGAKGAPVADVDFIRVTVYYTESTGPASNRLLMGVG